MVFPLALHVPFLDEWVVIAFFGLLLFGKRLPEVGRSIGKGIVEFKKGLAGIEDEIDLAAATKNAGAPTVRPSVTAEAPKFDPYTGQPIQPALPSAVPAGAKFDPYTGKPLSEPVAAATQTTSA